MICQFCKAEGAKSTLHRGMTSGTCMAGSSGGYDEDGKWVAPYDPNTYTTAYQCSRGHHFSVSSRQGRADQVNLVSTITPRSLSTPPTEQDDGN